MLGVAGWRRRLSQHRGVVKSGGGNHRGSIFRLLVGEALMRRDGPHVETWGVGGSPGEAGRARSLPPGTVNEGERPTEIAVSRFIGAMPFLGVRVDDPPGAESMRGVIERNAIALLSNLGKDPVDPASRGWLGLHSGHERVRGSGLWNNRHVEEQYDTSFLDRASGFGNNGWVKSFTSRKNSSFATTVVRSTSVVALLVIPHSGPSGWRSGKTQQVVPAGDSTRGSWSKGPLGSEYGRGSAGPGRTRATPSYPPSSSQTRERALPAPTRYPSRAGDGRAAISGQTPTVAGGWA